MEHDVLTCVLQHLISGNRQMLLQYWLWSILSKVQSSKRSTIQRVELIWMYLCNMWNTVFRHVCSVTSGHSCCIFGAKIWLKFDQICYCIWNAFCDLFDRCWRSTQFKWRFKFWFWINNKSYFFWRVLSSKLNPTRFCYYSGWN